MKAAGKKPTVCLDTTILSSYWYEGTDLRRTACQGSERLAGVGVFSWPDGQVKLQLPAPDDPPDKLAGFLIGNSIPTMPLILTWTPIDFNPALRDFKGLLPRSLLPAPPPPR